MIQLAASENLDAINQLKREWGKHLPNITVVPQFSDQQKWYTLETEAFDSQSEAERQLNALPNELTLYNPWIKLTPNSTEAE